MPDFKVIAREIWRWNANAVQVEAALSQAYEEGVRAEKARSAQEYRQEVARTPMSKHAYVPHSDYPWFCDVCGYPEHEVMKHDRAGDTGTAEQKITQEDGNGPILPDA
jgi:hypothetical protein